MSDTVFRSAFISDDERYRYLLTRAWSLAARRRFVAFALLNPSTADASIDDRTVGRCTGFARAWGYDGFFVVNLFALRSTDPHALLAHPDPVGPLNDQTLRAVATVVSEVVCGWGASPLPPAHRDRPAAVLDLLTSAGVRLRCLGLTRAGQPRHPLFVPGITPRQPYEPRSGATVPVVS